MWPVGIPIVLKANDSPLAQPVTPNKYLLLGLCKETVNKSINVVTQETLASMLVFVVHSYCVT